MLKLIAYLFQYRLIIASLLMLIWAVMVAIQRASSKRWWLRLMPLAFVTMVLGSVIYHPLVITSPKTRVVVHPGDSIPVTIELHPGFLSALFPSVGVDLPRCWSCSSAPAGMLTRGALTGSPYRFTIELPKTLISGVLVTSATAAMAGSSRPAIRSAFIELVVESRGSASRSGVSGSVGGGSDSPPPSRWAAGGAS